MKQYDYLSVMTQDVLNYIRNNIDLADYNDRDELAEVLEEDLWIDDSVTGNGSGSYFFSTTEAEEAICHNWDLLREALDELECDENPIKKGAEWCDVTIRCYLLYDAISAALDELGIA